MPPRYRVAVPLAALLLALVAVPASAEKIRPVPHALPPGQSVEVPSSSAAECVLGQAEGPRHAFQFLSPPDDEYFTLLDPDDSPDPCTSYNLYTVFPVIRDLITFNDLPGNPVMWVGGATPGVMYAPGVVQAASDGGFEYEWVFTVGANVITLAGLGGDNLQNTQGVGHGDSFCQITAQPGQTIRWTIRGQLVNSNLPGRVRNWLALCGLPTVSTETVILPFDPTVATPATLGSIKARYR